MPIFLIMLGTFPFSANRLSAAPEGILKEAIHWNLSSDWLDPSTGPPGTIAYLPIQFFHDALVKSMPEGNYTPCLAESYDISQDARVYEFKLRKGTKFHNGDTLTAEDVVFSFGGIRGGKLSGFTKGQRK
jgi:peptide/nickel transport system substrate-binding protein